jgi:hypothetical protein
VLPYLEIAGIIGLVFLGLLLGAVSSRLRKPYWVIGYLISLALVSLLVAGRCVYGLNFVQPFDMLLASRFRFAILALAVTIGLTTPLRRLPYRIERILVCALMSIVLTWFCIMPFLAPILVRDYLANLKSNVNSQGICFQSTDYTCGPAAATTALRKLGFDAEEGHLAVLSYSSPVLGTLPRCLANALKKEYADQGLDCSFRRFDSIGQLKQAEITLVVLKDHLLSDHCAAVLEVRDDVVVLADPVRGPDIITHEQFAKVWRFSGIALSRVQSNSI